MERPPPAFGLCVVLRSGDGRYAVWPGDSPVPAGWRSVTGPLPRADCRREVERRWAGLRAERRGRPGPTVHRLFRRQAALRPEAVAVLDEDGPLGYRELDRRSDGLARRLRELGVGPETVVPVCLERSAAMVVALLAVLKAGGGFLPLDPGHPAPRLAALVEDAEAPLVLAAAEQAPLLPVPVLPPGAWPDGPAPEDAGDPQDLAYLVYTSGSTGTPKGVPMSHRSMAFVISRVAEAYGLTAADRVLQLGALGYDTSLEQIFAPLISGATLVLGGRHTWAPSELAHRLPELGVTVADLTPTYWHHLLDVLAGSGRPPTTLRLLVVGGDTVHAEDCRTCLRQLPRTRLVNAYGLTETGITSTLCEIGPELLAAPAHAPVPVGRPLLGTHVHVLDGQLRPLPPGDKGEVHLGGLGLARGYWRAPAATAEAFLPDPYAGGPGERMYRTGDTARWRADGQLELLGRTDDQVKIRGFRVDPGEVESVLTEHPQVGQARVVASRLMDGARELTAYYTARSNAEPDLRGHLAGRLPDHLVPGSFVRVERMPVTAGGKIDRRRLAEPPARNGSGEGLGTAAEHGLAYLWAQLLEVDEVGPEDDFFRLGGNSLLAMEMLARARIMFGIGIGRVRDLTRALLGDPTLAGFTRRLHTVRTGGADRDGEPVDFTAEAELGVPVRRTEKPQPHWRHPEEILLTGATGFCGTHLLDALLTATDARVHCLVRAPDTEHALERLRASHQRFLHRDLDPARVVPLVGDLAEPLLGLGRPRFERLANRVDAIHHLGGQVNFLYPYHQLRAANVAGTREVIRLAGHSRAVPVHYLSSMAVLAGFGPAGVRRVTEETPLDHAEQLSVGYVESKWVAEALLHNAAAAGLPVSVYRVNDVTGDLATGTMNTTTELCALIKYLADSGTCPEVELLLDFVPADCFTRALVRLAGREGADGRVYHLTSPRPATLGALADRLGDRGRPVRRLPYPDWVEQLVGYAARHPEHPITPFVPLFVDRCSGTDLSISEMYFRPTFPLFSRANAERALRAEGLEFPPVDDQLIDFYLDRLELGGYLERAA